MTRYAMSVATVEGPYRYSLHRIWDRARPLMGWVMLNPSTADAVQDDPTIRRCVAFTRREGFGGLVVLNLFAYRARHPFELLDCPVDPVGQGNDTAIRELSRACGLIVAAWGSHRAASRERVDQVLRLLPAPPWFLGLNRDGQPRHPLYVPGSQVLLGSWRPRWAL